MRPAVVGQARKIVARLSHVINFTSVDVSRYRFIVQ